MATNQIDPYRSYNFPVEIHGIPQAGFQECSNSMQQPTRSTTEKVTTPTSCAT